MSVHMESTVKYMYNYCKHRNPGEIVDNSGLRSTAIMFKLHSTNKKSVDCSLRG